MSALPDFEEDAAFVRAAMQADLDQKDAEIERLRAALLAQEEADAANEGRVGYDKWQALEDKAKELRLAALGHQQNGDKT